MKQSCPSFGRLFVRIWLIPSMPSLQLRKSYRVYAWAGFAVIGIVITAAYFLWTVQRMFLGQLKEEYLSFSDMNLQEQLSLWPLVVLTFLIGVYPTFLLKIIQPAMQHIVETMEKAYGI